MKDAIGGSLLLNLVVIFSSVVILFFSSILAYSKAYKVKNKIVEIIEMHDGNIKNSINPNVIDTNVQDQINTELIGVGYLLSGAPSNDRCSQDSSRDTCVNLNTSEFNYCICEHSEAAEEGKTYEVITYIHFAFPVIGDVLTFPVKGETKVLGKVYDY